MRTPTVCHLLQEVERFLRQCFNSSWCKRIDALPLPIGGATTDPDARYGRAAATMAKGYKLHAICDPYAGIEVWDIQECIRFLTAVLSKDKTGWNPTGDNLKP
jgi:hypothetical protein